EHQRAYLLLERGRQRAILRPADDGHAHALLGQAVDQYCPMGDGPALGRTIRRPQMDDGQRLPAGTPRSFDAAAPRPPVLTSLGRGQEPFYRRPRAWRDDEPPGRPGLVSR